MQEEELSSEPTPDDTLLQEENIRPTNVITEVTLLNHTVDDPPELESEIEKRMRRNSHRVIYSTVFIMSIGFSIVLTGVWPYLKRLDSSASKEFLGWVVAANPLGQMITAPLLGWCATKVGSNRGAFIVTITSFIAGNILYALLPLFKSNVKYIMMISRFIVGVSSANIAVCRSYIASSTTIKERTTAISITAAAQAMGFILGPSIQTVMAFAYRSDETPSNSSFETVTNIVQSESTVDVPLSLLNMYTLAAWFVAFLGVLNLFLYLPYFYKECSISLKEAKREIQNSTDLSELKVDSVAIVATTVTFFAILFAYVLLETMIVPMCLDMYAWTPEFTVKVAGIGLTIAGAVSLVMFILSGKLANIFSDRIVYIVLGLLPLTFGVLLFLPIGHSYPQIKHCDAAQHQSNFSSDETRALVISSNCQGLGCPSTQQWCNDTPIIELPQFIVACTVTTLGYPVAVSLANAIYSKLIPPTSQGIWMGVLTSAGSLSRVIGPIFITYMYTSKGPFWTFLSLFFFLLTILFMNCCVYKRLQPLSFEREAPIVDYHSIDKRSFSDTI